MRELTREMMVTMMKDRSDANKALESRFVS